MNLYPLVSPLFQRQRLLRVRRSDQPSSCRAITRTSCLKAPQQQLFPAARCSPRSPTGLLSLLQHSPGLEQRLHDQGEHSAAPAPHSPTHRSTAQGQRLETALELAQEKQESL